MSNAIEMRGVRKSFGRKVAVDGLDLAVPSGGLYGLIGPNGAGKTTSIRMVMSILFPDEGEIRVLGHASALEAKDRIGYLPEERGVYKKMKVGAFLRYLGRLKGVDDAALDRRIGDWLERVGLAEVEGQRCDELSKGMQQKVQFVSAVIHRPDLLILDEPFSGLDPVNMRLLRDLIREEHERGTTIIFSTHVMVQAEQVCDHLVMIDRGRKVLDESLASIRRRHDPRAVLFEPLDPAADLAPLGALPGVESVRSRDGHAVVRLAPDRAVDEAIADIARAVPAARVEVQRPTLEDVFIRIVTAGSEAGAEEREALRAELRDGPALPGGGGPLKDAGKETG